MLNRTTCGCAFFGAGWVGYVALSNPVLMMVKDMIKRSRKQNDFATLIVGVGSPIAWAVFLLIAIWFWS
jgi:hypothetical protein